MCSILIPSSNSIQSFSILILTLDTMIFQCLLLLIFLTISKYFLWFPASFNLFTCSNLTHSCFSMEIDSESDPQNKRQASFNINNPSIVHPPHELLPYSNEGRKSRGSCEMRVSCLERVALKIGRIMSVSRVERLPLLTQTDACVHHWKFNGQFKTLFFLSFFLSNLLRSFKF